MEIENKKLDRIDYVSDFVNLFMAIYSLDSSVRGEENEIMIDKNFKVLMEIILKGYSISSKKLNGKYLYTDGVISCEEFMEKLKNATIKEYWQDKFSYDFDRDCIITSIKESDAKKEISKYDKKVINKMNGLVEHYKCLSNYPSVDGELNIEPTMYANLKNICKKYEKSNETYTYKYKKKEKIS